jgi:hypothetical protein
MSTPFFDIRSAFSAKLLTLSPLPSIAWDNVSFTPVIGTPYLRPFLRAGRPVQAEIGEAGQNRHVGFYQVSIYAPSGAGLGVIKPLIESVCNLFKRGTVLTYSTNTLTVIMPEIGPEDQGTDWVVYPITIYYHLLAAN